MRHIGYALPIRRIALQQKHFVWNQIIVFQATGSFLTFQIQAGSCFCVYKNKSYNLNFISNTFDLIVYVFVFIFFEFSFFIRWKLFNKLWTKNKKKIFLKLQILFFSRFVGRKLQPKKSFSSSLLTID